MPLWYPQGSISKWPQHFHDILHHDLLVWCCEEWTVIAVFWVLSHPSLNSRKRKAHSWIYSVEFQCVFTSIIASSAMGNLAHCQLMNSFDRPGVSVINTSSILCYMKVSFSTSKISWNMYILNYLCYTWFHGWHLIDSSVALFSKPLTLPNGYAFISSKLLIVLTGFPRLGAALYTKTAD